MWVTFPVLPPTHFPSPTCNTLWLQRKLNVLLKERGGRTRQSMEKGRKEKRKKRKTNKNSALASLSISHHPYVLFSLLDSASSKTYPNLATSFYLHYYLSSLEHHLFLYGAFISCLLTSLPFQHLNLHNSFPIEI